MAEKGVVTEIKNNIAVVKMVRTEACAKCRACIAGMSEQEMFIDAQNACDAKVGDWVEMELVGSGFFQAVLIMYGIPLIALIVGMLVGFYVISPVFHLTGTGTDEIIGFITGLLFTFLAYLWIRSQETRWSKKKYQPVATKITQPDA